MTATQPRQSYDWKQRYGPRWPEIAKQTESLQTIDGQVVCAWCGDRFDHRETQVHHALYSLDGKTLLKDNVIPLEHAFAVCGTADTPGTCHHALHQEPLWIKDHENRVAADRNDDNVIFQLQANTRQFINSQETEPMTTTTDGRQRWRDRFRQTADRGREVYEESFWLRLTSWLLLSGLIAALGWVCWMNIAPYVTLVKLLGVGTPNWLTYVPLIGWFVKTWSDFVAVFIGVMVWAIVQVLQCLWLLVSMDRKALQGAVHRAQVGRYQLRGFEDGKARAVIRKANRVPYFFIRWAPVLSLAAFGFDLAIGISLYPPAKDLSTFLFALSAGMWSEIDLGNTFKLLLMLFGVIALLSLLIVTWQWVKSRQSAPADNL